MRGSTVESADTFVEFEAPDKDKIVHGAGSTAVVRVIVYDNKAHRMSGVTADTILELKATSAPFPLLLVLGGSAGAVVIVLLLVVVLRGGNKKRPTGPAPTPVIAGSYSAGAMGGAPAMSASRATLQGTAGSYSLRNGSELKLGRDPNQCNIVIPEPAVSSLHATLKLDNGVFYVRDEGSNNGTFVNNAGIAPRVLISVTNGSLLRFGPVEFTVRLE
ncbi:MAG TPA: FHA domain-containing protein [Polyangiaceae bacterium]|nr:FHA domain-containing protein [Polyangiaceae bacterium]